MIRRNSLHDSNSTSVSVAMETVSRGGERHRKSLTMEYGVPGEDGHAVLHPKYDSDE